MQLRIQKIENITYIPSVLVQVLPVAEYATCVAFSNNNVFASTKAQKQMFERNLQILPRTCRFFAFHSCPTVH